MTNANENTTKHGGSDCHLNLPLIAEYNNIVHGVSSSVIDISHPKNLMLVGPFNRDATTIQFNLTNELNTYDHSSRAATKRQAAAHQAGHALVAHLLGFGVKKVLSPRNITWNEWMSVTYLKSFSFCVSKKPRRAIAYAMYLYAGWCGEEILGQETDRIYQYPSSELEQAKGILVSAANTFGVPHRDLCCAVLLATLECIRDKQLTVAKIQEQLMLKKDLTRSSLNQIFEYDSVLGDYIGTNTVLGMVNRAMCPFDWESVGDGECY